jgi:hypothetical protein
MAVVAGDHSRIVKVSIAEIKLSVLRKHSIMIIGVWTIP